MTMDSDEIILDAEDRMDKAVANLQDRLKGIRTGRASPGLVEGLRADYYGSPTPLKQIANVSAPEPRLLVIKPFDPGSLKAIETAIQKSDLGINPSSDGKIIRLQVPPLSQEQRQRLASQIKEFAEEAKVAVRNIRRDANKHADLSKKDGALTEDELKRVQGNIQDLTRDHESTINGILDKKTAEVVEE